MKKWNVFAAVVFTAVSIFAQGPVDSKFLWDGDTDTLGQVITGSTETKTSGYWYDFTDKGDSGTSVITYPAGIEANSYGNFYGPLVEAYGGIKASITMGEGYEYPYAGIGFNIWSEDQEGVDISEWGGICLAYESTISFGIELAVENEKTVTGYDNYKATVVKYPSSPAINYPWSKFSQGGWGTEVPIDDVLAKTYAIKLKFEGTAGTSGNFLICQIGSLNQCTRCRQICCLPPDTSISVPVRAASSVKMSLNGRMLSFEGIALAKAEVVDLQGRVVKSATISTTMDLAGLDAGIYILRVSSHGFLQTKKIFLK
ncbi:T9SS type A sorting domain-containing protein [Fibrobacter sp. UWR2]|uniref:T9SS type A sorting domain-containing protein n=1 Tax=Fibrobacter sp. UWR2 TaxID=1964352 RepID=UPI000B520DA5|nr:T9SS type A sorting domain-containing protein [Fibrobacter sp. UWR2]OWU99897.1 hypothetical protein B7994_09485 [Fibrobacter sp. UWR2]